MTRALSANVQELVSKRVLAEIPVVKLTRVIDHSIPTKTDPAYFTTHPVSGVYGVPETNPQLPFLQRVTFPTETMAHLPSPVRGSVDSLTRRIQFVLANVQYQDETLYEFLTALARLDRAELELSMLLVPGPEITRQGFISSATAGETLSFFVGEVARVTAVGDEITCTGVSALPVTPWKLVPDDGGDPRDRGLRLPLALGKGAVVACVTLQIGDLTSLQQELTIDSTTIVLDDASGFQATGTGMVGAELVSWSGKEGNQLTGVERGLQGTHQADHIVGTFVLELGPAVLAVSSHPVSAVTALYVKGPSGGTVKVSPLLHTVTLDDESNDPGSSGDGITTVSFTSGQLATLVHLTHADAAVIQQAQYTNDTPDLTEQSDALPFANQSLVAGNGAQGTWTDVGLATVNWTFLKSSSNTQDLTGFYDLSDFSASSLVDTLRFVRFEFTIDVNAAAGGTLTVGLRLDGAEGVLVDALDGSIVATFDITTTGTFVVEGSIFVAEEGQVVANMGPFVIDFIKSQAPGGNPSFDIDITEVRIVYLTIDDTTSSTSKDRGTISDDALGEIPNVNAWSAEDGTTVGGVDYSSSMFWNGRHTQFASGSESLAAKYERDVGGDEDFRYAEANLDGALYDPQPESPSLPDEEFAWYLKATSPAPDDGVPVIETIRVTLPQNLSDPTVFTDSGNTVSINAVLYNGPGSDVVATQTLKTNSYADPGSSADQVFEWTVEAGEIRAGLQADSPTWADDLRIAIWGSGGYVPGTGTGDGLQWAAILLSYELAVKSLFVPIDRPVDAQIQALAGAGGLQFFAICDGPEADDGTWNADEGEVLEHPGDLMRYWLEVIHGLTNVDSATFSGSAYADATPGYRFGFDARNLGSTFEQVLLQMGYEGSANVAQPSGGDWTITFPNASFQFPAPSVTLTDLADLIAIGKDTDEIRTRLTVFSHFDPRFDSADNRSFTQVQTTDPLAAAVIAREEEFGRLDNDPQFLLAHNNEAGVTNWRLRQEFELGRFARIFLGRVNWFGGGYALEIGDVVSIQHPNVDSGVAVKSRIIETQPSQERGKHIRAAEVT